MKERRPIDTIFGEVKRYEPPPEPSEPSPVKPPASESIPLSIFSKIPELRTLAKQVGGGLSEWAWQYPGDGNGQPHEQIYRHLYNPSLKSVCPHCHEQVTTYIDIARLISGPHCSECNGHQLKSKIITYSYLRYELERKPHDAITSDFEGYISKDPLLEEEALWNQGRIFHLGAPMGSGKTYLIYQRAREAAESGAITLIVDPRVSLAKGAHADLREDTSLGWGLFYEGHKGEIGKYGAICTLGWMPYLLKKIVKDYPDRPVRIFVDEIDFADSLRIAGIFKDLSTEIKEVLKERKDAIGIVTAGQTASTLALKAIAKEIDCDLTGYYLSPRPAQHHADLFIVDTTEVEQGKNRIAQDLIDRARNIIATGKKCYILGDERKSAEIIAAHFGDKALLYDAFHKSAPSIQELHRLKRLPDDKSVLVTTTAVDVGVSIHDENAETIAFQVNNPLNTDGLSSTVQQCPRNRAKTPLTVYALRYQNALPLAPQQAIGFQTAHAKQKLNPAENEPEGLIEKLGIKDAMNSLAADQPETFFTHHLSQAGFKVQVVKKDWESVGFEQMQVLRKQIKDSENEQVKAMAKEFLCPEQMLTEREIRNKNWEQLQPAPFFQLAHERANELLCCAGWIGEAERFVDEDNTILAEPRHAFQAAGVTEDMWEAARQANDANLSAKKISLWSKGYLTTHHENAAFSEFDASRKYESHHRSDAIFIGTLAKELLSKLPRTPAPKEAFGQALINAIQSPFGTDPLSALMKDGSVSPAIAKKVRFLDLGKDAVPTEAHFDLVKYVLSYYPSRIAKVGDLYQLAAPTNAEQVEAFKLMMKCRVKNISGDPDIDPEPENGNLTPPPASDPKEDDKKLVVSMRNEGFSFRKIEQAIDVPRNTAYRWCAETSSRPTNFLGCINIRNKWDTPSAPELPENRTGTGVEVDSQKLAAPSEKLAASPAASFVGLEAHCEMILELLTTGEKKRSEIVASLGVNAGSIDRALAKLHESGQIVKLKDKPGVYSLPEHSTSDPVTPARSPIVLSERRTPIVTPQVNYNDPQHYQFLPGPLPLSPSETEIQPRVVEWIEGNRDLFEGRFPSDITELMQAFPDLFEFKPFRPTGDVLDARVSDRGRLLRQENFAILLDPSRQGDSVEAIERSLFYGGDSSLYAVRLAFFLALRNNVGKRWIEAIKSAVDFEISRAHLCRDAQHANISVSRIHSYWGEAVDYRKGVVHPIVPFAKHWMHSS